MLKDRLLKIKDSEIMKLVYEGSVIGLRIKSYNWGIDSYDYYDFSLKIVQNNVAVRDFINSIQSSLRSVNLIEYNDVLMTKDEIDGIIVTQEFKSEQQAVSVLSCMPYVYQYKKVG